MYAVAEGVSYVTSQRLLDSLLDHDANLGMQRERASEDRKCVCCMMTLQRIIHTFRAGLQSSREDTW